MKYAKTNNKILMLLLVFIQIRMSCIKGNTLNFFPESSNTITYNNILALTHFYFKTDLSPCNRYVTDFTD